MADNFGLKIGLEGEKEFKDALRDINQSFKVLGSEMNLVSSQFDKNDQSVQAVTARNEVLNKSIDAQKAKIETLRAALQNATDSFGENDKRTQNWTVQLNNAEAELNNMERELGETGSAADETGSKFEKLGGVLKGVGVAIGAAFVAVGAATVGAAKALTDMTVGASQYADEVLTMSTVTGISTESLQAYKYAAELVDTSMETLTGSMARNIRSMTSAREGTGAAASAYKALGISVTDTSGNLRDSETVYWEAIDALGNVSSETERDALAMQLFGKSAQDLNPLIEQGSAGIAQLTEEAKAMGAVMSQESLEALGKFDDSMQRLKSGSEAAKNALGLVLLPQLQVLADDGVGLLGDFTKGLNEANGDWTKISQVISETVGGIVNVILEQLPKIIELALSIVSAIGAAIMDNLPIIVDAATNIVMTLLQGLIDSLPAMTEGALQLVLALVNGIVASLPAIVEAAVMMIATLVSGIGTALPQLIPAIVQAVVLVARTLVENLPLILDAALQLILGLAQGLLDAIPLLVAELPAIITALVDFLIGAIPQIIEAGIELLTSLVDALPEIIDAIVEAIPEIIDGIITAVIESIPQLVDAGVRLLISLIQNLPKIITTVVAAIPKIISSLIDAIIGNIDKIILAGVQLLIALVQNTPKIIIEVVKAIPKIVKGIIDAIIDFVPKLADAGLDLIKGLWQGIKDAGQWLWEKISGFFGDVMGKIKNFFGIKSPSAVFADLGNNMGLGIGVGFEGAMKKVGEDMKKAIPTDFDVDAGLNLSGSLARNAGGLGTSGTTINQSISVVSPKALSEKELAREFKNLSRKLALAY